MRQPHPFALVDVFSDRPLAGNPLAVVTDADDVDDDTLRSVAREANQAETTFLLRPTLPGSTARLRSFTASGAEVVGAGHNSLGAWWWLACSGRLTLASDGRTDLFQEIGGEQLPVGIEQVNGEPRRVVLRQGRPVAGRGAPDPAALAVALDLPVDALLSDQSRVFSTGVAHLMVRVRAVDDLRRVSPRPEVLRRYLGSVDAEGCYVFAVADEPARPLARFFNPTVGIVEDAATGTAAGPLAAHLVALGLVADGSVVRVAQGAAVGRPSELEVRVDGDLVELRGRCAVSVQGWLALA